MPAWAVRALDEAQGLAAQRCFAQAVQACIPVLQGPARAVDLLTGLCMSWEKVEHERLQKHEDDLGFLSHELAVARDTTETLRGFEEEKELELVAERERREGAERVAMKLKDDSRSLAGELLAARERCDAWRKLKEELDKELRSERRRGDEAERQLAWLRRREQHFAEALREASLLRQRVSDLEARLAAQQHQQQQAMSRESVVRQLSELECIPLRSQCSAEDRLAVKKRLLVKWHPDKQPSADHVALATEVMQELQNRPEWEG